MQLSTVYNWGYVGRRYLQCFEYLLLCSFLRHRVIPNCIMKAKSERKRAFIGNQIEECRDASGLFYILCFQRGYLVNWENQVSELKLIDYAPIKIWLCLIVVFISKFTEKGLGSCIRI